MPSPGDAGYGIWLGNFYCGVRSMAPFGVWLPWQEGVTLAAAFSFTENVCFECADTWLQLDALEFDPPRRSGVAAAGQMCSGFACSTSLIYTEMVGSL
jgi:hypothetical protein